jgi:hypothetical protein
MRVFISELVARWREVKPLARLLSGVILLAACVVVGAVWVYLGRTEARNLATADRLLREGDLRRAQLLLEQAVQVKPGSIAAQAALGDFLDRVGAPTAAARWETLVRLSGEDRFRWKQAASLLRLGDVGGASAVLDEVSPAGRAALEHHRVLAGIALARGDRAEVGKHLAAMVRLDAANVRSRFALAAHRLGERESAEEARRELEVLAREGALRARATLELMRDAPRRWPGAADPEELLATRLLDGAGLVHLRAGARRGRSRLIEHLKAPPYPESADAAVVVGWLTAEDRAGEALEWSDRLPEETRVHPALAAAAAEAALRARRWERLEQELGRGAWGFIPRSALGEAFALRAEAERGERTLVRWQALLERQELSAPALRAFHRLAETWGLDAEAERALRVAVRRMPQERWAWEGLSARLVRRGDTAALLEHLENWIHAMPRDLGAERARLLVIFLAGRDDRTSRAEASELQARAPRDPAVAVVQALAWRAEGRGADGLRLLESRAPAVFAAPRGTLVMGLLLAEAGRRDEARVVLRNVEEPLLPEERRLLEQVQLAVGTGAN